MPKNKFKNYKKTIFSIFDIKINTTIFTKKLSVNKLEKTIKKTGEILTDTSNFISYINI